MLEERKILIIGGPTGVGKSSLSLTLARQLRGEIISADSRQFYRGLDIGTDKVPVSQRKEIPHHLVDCLVPGESFDISQFHGRVITLVEEIFGRGRCPIIVGGSGLYLRCLWRGLFSIPAEKKTLQVKIRSELESKPTAWLWAKLKEVDPRICLRLHCRDRRRIRRALEVYLLTGKPMSRLQQENMGPVLSQIGKTYYFIIDRPRGWLYAHLIERVETMLKNGWLEEVARLQQAGYANFLREKAPIGYAQLLEVLEGKATLEK
ncbi:MAG TPA: tRNA (adenosine(37)-N6)-dimethylallyltransferase MiaA, partial [bacterium]|nr:tRNA (adenosine(37)-N6)-dimethylallyltransferase MiaA [bacterium]